MIALLCTLMLGQPQAAEVITDSATFWGRGEIPACDQPVLDLEELSFNDDVGDTYAAEGVVALASTEGAIVTDAVSSADCRGSRCAEVPVDLEVGLLDPPWFGFALDTPTRVLSFYLLSFGASSSSEVATVQGYREGSLVESVSFTPGGRTTDGGVFVGLVFASEVDEILLHAAQAADVMGWDDLWFPPADCHDGDGDGVSEYRGDCDDEDASIHPGAVESCDGIDTDCSGSWDSWELDGDGDGALDCLDQDGDGASVADGDCDDHDPSRTPGAPEACDGVDNDCSGGVAASEEDSDGDGWRDCQDTDGDGVTTAEGDCDPWDGTSYPGAPELCDGADNACAGEVAADEEDGDHDGWRDCVDTDGDGVTTAEGDCEPWDAASYPGAVELCDGVDNACAGTLAAREEDSDHDGHLDCVDTDGDGVTTADGDCAPWDAYSFPGATELCDGADNGCTGTLPTREEDGDSDGWIDCVDTDSDGIATADGDCAPWDAYSFPGATELCDGADNACLGSLASREQDSDSDGWIDCLDTDEDGVATADGDCAPWDPTSFPGATELCDGTDNACLGSVADRERDGDWDGVIDCQDTDGDGVATADGDCAPWDPTSHPGAEELCDGVDNTCAGQVPLREQDTDLDGYPDCQDTDSDGISTADGDCLPWDPLSHPGAEELCDGIDNACRGTVPLRELDSDWDGVIDCHDTDGDGVPTADGDCLPWDPLSYPGAEELCDGVDNACRGELADREHDGDLDGFPDCQDTDGDGLSTADGDCDPWDATTWTGAEEVCDGLDNRCLGALDPSELDQDGDGWMPCEGDCNDLDPHAHPGAVERANGFDDDCDGVATGGTVGQPLPGCSTAPGRGSAWLLLLAPLLASRRRLDVP